jgi:hypothetical protein
MLPPRAAPCVEVQSRSALLASYRLGDRLGVGRLMGDLSMGT